MTKTIIKVKNAPQPIGPYSMAVRTGALVYTAGQIPIDPETNEVTGSDITAQTQRVLSNLQAVLEESGASLETVVKTTVFLKNMNDFAAMNAVYGKFFNADAAPARSAVEVARLPKDVLVEIEAVAEVKT